MNRERIERIDAGFIAALQGAIVFLNSPWSIQSRTAERALLKALSRNDRRKVKLYIVEDGGAELGIEFFQGMAFGGYGETFWVRNGVIVGKMSNFTENDSEKLIELTRRIEQ